MFGWLFGKKNKRPLSHLPSVFMEINPTNGQVFVSAGWPKPTNENELAEVIRAFTHFLLLLDNARLTPIVEQAISVYGENHDDSMTATSVIATYNNCRSKDNQPQQHDSDNQRPIVSPIEAFRSQE